MGENQSLIFVYPLSESLKSYFELLSLDAQENGLEIYEIDDPNEFNQLYQSLGTSIALFGDPKKCLKCLAANKKYTAQLGSKILLFAQQNLPSNTLTKFHEIGLTEFLVEPVATKSISYKVNLLLKSLRKRPVTQNKKEETKTFKNESHEINQKEQVSTVKSMMILEDPSKENYNVKKEKKTDLKIVSQGEGPSFEDDALVAASTDKNQTSNRMRADVISSYWKGREKKADINLFDETSHDKDNKIAKTKLEPPSNHPQKKRADTNLKIDAEVSAHSRTAISHQESAHTHTKNGIQLHLTRDHSEEQKDRVSSAQPEAWSTKQEGIELCIERDQKKQNKKRSELILEQEENKRSQKTSENPLDFSHQSANALNLELENDPSPEEDETNLFDQDQEFKKAKEELLLDLSLENSKTAEEEAIDISSELKKQKERDSSLSLTQQEDLNKSRYQEEMIEKYIKTSLKHTSGFSLVDKEEHEDEEFDDDLFSDEDFDQNTENSLELHLEQDMNDSEDQNDESLEFDKNQNKEKSKELELEDDQDDRSNTKKRDDDLSQSPIHLADNRADQLEKYYKGIGNSHKKQGWRIVQRVAQKKIHLNLISEDETCPLAASSHPQADDSTSKIDHDRNFSSDNRLHKYDQEDEDLSEKKQQYVDHLDYLNFKRQNEQEELSYGNSLTRSQDQNFDLLNRQKGGPKSPLSDIESASLNDQTLFKEDHTETQKVKDQAIVIHEDDLKFDESRFETPEQDEETDGRPIIFAHDCGLIELIKVSQFFHDEKISIKEHMQNIAESLSYRLGGQTCFFLSDPNQAQQKSLFFSFPEILAHREGRPEILSSWHTLETIKRPFWDLMKLPAWSDQTFQDQEIDYFHPYYEDGICLGYAVCFFPRGLKAEKANECVILLESARALFLELAPPSSKSTSPTQLVSSVAKSQEPAKKGTLRRLFGS